MTARQLAGIIVLAGAVLRFHGLDSLPLAEDALYTLRDSTVSELGWNRPVYFVIQRVVLEFFPASPLILRFPAFVFGVAGIWLTWLFVKTVFNEKAGVVAALLVAVSPWHMHISQFARYYSLLYLLLVLFLLIVIEAENRRKKILYAGALLTFCTGVLTHISFLFPLPGIFLGLMTIRKDSAWSVRWPTKEALAFLWVPAGVLGTLYSAYVLGLLPGVAVEGKAGVSVIDQLRLIPAIAQWLTPVIVVAAVVAGVALLRSGTEVERRWAVVALLGALSCVAALLVSTLAVDVYADYAIGLVPLAYSTIGVGIVGIARELDKRGTGFVVGMTAVILAGVLPGTVSHMSDGTRFDLRPAYAEISKEGPESLVVGWPKAMQKYYAPHLNLQQFRWSIAQLEETRDRTGKFWFIAAKRRYGLVGDGTGTIQRWLDQNCRVALRTRGHRFDYRVYEVLLYWCGDSSIPLAGGR